MPPSITVRFGGNLDDLKKAMAEGKVLIENTSSSMDKLASKLGGSKVKADADVWVGAIRKVGDVTKLTAADQDRANKVMEKAITYYKAAGQQVPGDIQKIADATRRATSELEKLQKTGEGLKRTGDQLKGIGTGLSAAVSVPLAGLGYAAIKAASDYNAAVRAIRVGTGATGQELANLTTSYQHAFAQVPEGAAIVGQALANLSSRTGQTGAALEELTVQEVNLSRIARTEVGPLIAATTRMFGDWSISTDKQSSSLDYLFRTTQRTGANLQTLTELIVQFGAPLRALGFDFEHAAALLGKWEKEGVNLETVLAGMKMALSKFAAAGVDPQAALQSVILRIKEAKTESEATSIAFQTFGKRAAVDMGRAILEGRFAIEDLVSSLKTGSDTVNKAAWDTLTLAQKTDVLKHSLEEALVPIGAVFLNALRDALPHVRNLAGGVGQLTEAFGELPGPAQAGIVGVGSFLALLGPGVIVAGALVSSIGKLAGAASLAAPAAATAATGATQLSIAWAGLKVVAAGLGLAVVAIVGALGQVYAAYKLLDWSGQLDAAKRGYAAWKAFFATGSLAAAKEAHDTEAYIQETKAALKDFDAYLASRGMTGKRTGDIELPAPAAAPAKPPKALSEASEAAKQLAKDIQSAYEALSGQKAVAAFRIQDAAFSRLREAGIRPTGEALDAYRKLAFEAADGLHRMGKETEALAVETKALGTFLPAVAGAWVDALNRANTATSNWAPKIEGALTVSRSFGNWLKEAPQIVQPAAIAIESAWTEIGKRISQTLEQLRMSISGSFASMMLGAKGFKAGMLDIWSAIKAAAVNVFAQIADAFIGGMLKRMIAAVAGARLGGVLLGAGSTLAATGVSAGTGAAAGAAAGGGSGMFFGGGGGGMAAAPYLGPAAGALMGGYLGYKTGNYGLSMGAGAATGAGIGAMVGGPVGALVGWGVGAIAGAIGSYLHRRKERQANQAATQSIKDTEAELLSAYGSLENIDRLGRQVGVDLAGAWGDQAQAGAAHFAQLLAQFNKELQRNKDLQSALAAVAPGQLAPKSLIEQMTAGNLTDESKSAIGQYMTTQTSAGVGAIQKIATAGGPFTAASAAGVGAGVLGVVAQMQEQGMGARDIAQAVGPAIEELAKRFETLGVSGGDAFNSLRQDMAYLNDEGVAKLLDGASGIGDLMTSLANLGRLDEKTFQGLASQITVTREELEKQGKGGDQAMRALQPQLQRIWELQQQFGYQVDASTQLLLDQGLAAGTIGEQFKSPTDKMLTAIDKLIERMGTFLSKMFGIDDAAKEGSGAIDREFKGKEVRVNVRWNVEPFPTGPDDGTGGGGRTTPRMAAGGVVTRPTFALIGEAGPEAVIPLNRVRSVGGVGAAEAIAEALASQRPVSVQIVIPAGTATDQEMVEQRIVPRLVQAIDNDAYGAKRSLVRVLKPAMGLTS